jgi:hypothetical protein
MALAYLVANAVSCHTLVNPNADWQGHQGELRVASIVSSIVDPSLAVANIVYRFEGVCHTTCEASCMDHQKHADARRSAASPSSLERKHM